jgi:hypothetical protein
MVLIFKVHNKPTDFNIVYIMFTIFSDLTLQLTINKLPLGTDQ